MTPAPDATHAAAGDVDVRLTGLRERSGAGRRRRGRQALQVVRHAAEVVAVP